MGKLGQVDLKPLLNTACANIFNAYFCSVARRNYDDPILNEYCTDFDKLFWEVNNGRAMDVLACLLFPYLLSSSPSLGLQKGEPLPDELKSCLLLSCSLFNKGDG